MACLFGGEHSLYARAGSVALPSPGSNLADERLAVTDAAVKTLSPQNADFDFDHVQPTGMLRGVTLPRRLNPR